jgi:hypothetical protein
MLTGVTPAGAVRVKVNQNLLRCLFIAQKVRT